MIRENMSVLYSPKSAAAKTKFGDINKREFIDGKSKKTTEDFSTTATKSSGFGL
jgi:hypothetical protein